MINGSYSLKNHGKQLGQVFSYVDDIGMKQAGLAVEAVLNKQIRYTGRYLVRLTSLVLGRGLVRPFSFMHSVV